MFCWYIKIFAFSIDITVADQISFLVRQAVLVVTGQRATIQEQEGITVHVLQAIMVRTARMRPMSVYRTDARMEQHVW